MGPLRSTALHQLWRSSGVPGELTQGLRTPALFEQAAQLVTVESMADYMPCGRIRP